MRTLRFAAVLALLVLAGAAEAQRAPFELTAWGTFTHFSGTTATDSFGTQVRLGDSFRPGVSFNVPVGSLLSVEAGAFFLKSRGALTYRGQEIASMGSATITPLTLLVQFHPARRGPVDPYVGVGGAYTVFGTFDGADLSTLGVGPVSVADTFSFAACAGVRFALSDAVGLTIDARYLHLRPDSTAATTGGKLELDLRPILASAGLSLRF